MNTESGRSQVIRIHNFKTPSKYLAGRELLFAIVGLMTVWALSYFGVFLIFTRYSLGSAPVPGIAYAYAIVLSILGSLLVMHFVGRYQQSRLWRILPFRKQRLEAVLRHPQGVARLPHRKAELILRKGRLTKRRIRLALRSTPPGHVLWLNFWRDRVHTRPIVTDTHFEPIDLKADLQQLVWLVRLNFEARKNLGSGRGQIQKAKSSRARVLIRFVRVLILVALSGLLLASYLGLISRYIGIFVLTMLLPIFVRMAIPFSKRFIYPLFFENRFFLMPGALICRHSRLWPRIETFSQFTPSTNALILDARSGTGALLDNGKIRTFQCFGFLSWAIAAGWLSAARTPSIQEIQTFLGQHPDSEQSEGKA